ncbi:outer membrane autotransporter barrel domain protein [Rickettsia endosymbiont of Ixodes pacificus]|nr:autotransporter outer membrane beta-barrel domain-containing protein [Rickettsia endosymbiont of Ixodes pacificus]KJW02278.1 outer membrane autotransporter barrel domain protein [Rickettsia endosymbiont of Ixodes pacificus]
MANISPKLFQKAIQKGLKTALFTTSTAALMLSSSGALGVAAGVISTNDAVFSDLAAAGNWNKITAGGVANGTPVDGPQDNKAFTYGGNHTITADEVGRIITAINVAATNPGGLNITENTSVGSIDTDGNLLPVTIIAGKSLTLTGTAAVVAHHGFGAFADTYTGLGNITLGGANAGLIIQSATPAKITLTENIDGGGIITANTDAAINGTIGNVNPAAQISVGASTLSLGGAVIKATTTNLTNAASVLTLTNANAVLTGAIDNTTGGDNVGVLNLNGALSQVTGNIGNTNSLAELSVGAGLLQVQGGVVKANAINLTNNASAVTFMNPVVVTGAIDNTGNAGNGVATFTGASTVTGNIGNTAALATVNVGAGITLQAGGNLITNNINFGAGSTLEFNGPLDGGGNIITYGFKGAIVNGNNATLNVNTKLLIAYDPTAGTIATINIKADNNFAFDASAGDVTILDGQAIVFEDANSILTLSNLTGGGVNNILLAADLAAPGANEGQLIFDGGVNGLNIGSNLAGTVRNIGDAGGNKFENLLINHVVTITDDVNLGIHDLVINDNADFTSSTAFNADAIQINNATYRIDANGGDLNVPAANIEFAHADAELVLQNSSNANDRTITLGADIDPNNDDEGIVTLNSVNAGRKLTIDGGITFGRAKRLQAIKFQGAGNLGTVGITFNTANIELDTTGVLELGATTANVTLINDAVQLTQTGNIGGFLDFNAKNGTVTLNNNVNVAGAVQNTGGTNNGTLIALGASNLNSVNGIAMLKVGAGAVSITKGGNTSITEIQGNGTALLTLPANFNLTGSINKTGGQALKLNFTNGGSVSGVVGTVANSVGDITTAGATSFASSVNAKGTATLSGTTSFADTFTNTGAVTLAKGSITNFAKNVTATRFAANGATINFGNSLAFNSNITGSGTTLTSGANQVTYTGTGSFTDMLTLNTTFDGAAKSGGNILIKSGSTLDLSGVSTLALVVTATNFDINNIDPNTKYTVISAETAGGLKPTPADNVKVTVNNDNRFVNFTFDASTLTLFAKDVSQEVIDNNFKPGGPLTNIPNAANVKKSLELMEQAPIGSDARLAFGNWGKLTPIQEADAVTHLMQDVVKPSDTITAINNQVILSNISSSLINLNARMDAIQPAAVAAGDEDRDAKFGAWISPFVGNATQKMRNNISGYKSDTTGGTIGFDGLVNDDLALGLAYTRADTDIKLKNNKTGDNKVESNIYSVYGLYNVPYENLFVEAIASYSDNKIRSKSRRVITTALATTAYQTANGKYKSESYTGQLMAGYTYAMPENINLTPLAGLRYSTIKDKGYKETGTTYQNLTVKGKNYNTFDGLLGAKVSSNINVGEVVLTPELYAMVDYVFKNKVPAIDARLQGMTAPFPTNSFKQSKTSFDVGVGVTAKHKMMEYGINYDTNIGSKYFAQQGSVKVRVNF